MKERQTRTDRLFEENKQELRKAFETAPTFGTTTLTFHFMEGRVKRVVHKREESVIPGADSGYSNGN